ncbi:MAG: M28 family peptidase [Anaerolineaceae bacterium]|nr:M28 family peptidase [Anaerolineaceae bacterium]
MPQSSHSQVRKWLEHIRVLAVEIGPRGPTLEGERKGAEYARDQFLRMGLSPVWETFKSARSIFLPHLIGGLAMLLAFAIYPLGGRVTAAVSAGLSLLVLATELLELGFADNLYRRILPKGESQNVYAIIPPAGEHQQDLVLVGHLDTQRTPFIFRTPVHVKAYDNFVTITFITFIAQVVIFSLSIFLSMPWAWYAAIPTVVCSGLLAAICVEADRTPFTAGANDNATAAGIVLALAENYARSPLQHTRILAVCTGCEEVQHYGMIDFYQRHREGLKNPKAIVFEMLGCAGPAWLTREGIIVPFKPDPGLLHSVEELSDQHPEWGAYPSQISGGNTEMADAARFKVPAITLFGQTREGVSPYWHQLEDTFDKMNPEIMEKTWELTTGLIEKIDAE